MKFQCDRCKTRYSIGEEKIRGKVLKIRCKNCSAVITVREGQSATTGVEAKSGKKAAPAAAAKGLGAERNGTGSKKGAVAPAASPVLEDAFNRAMSRLPTPDPAKDLRGGDDDSTSQARAADLMGLDTSDADGDEGGPPLEPEWYVSIDGDQEGPFSLAQAQKRVSKKQPQEEMHAWQEGFDDWLPVDRIPDLAGHIPAPPAARKARASAPPIPGDAKVPMAASRGAASSGAAGLSAAGAKAAGAKAPASDDGPLSLAALAKAQSSSEPAAAAEEGGDFDFDIGEASRVVKLPMLMPPPRGDAATTGNIARAGLPGMGGGNGAARGTGGMPAVGGIVGDDVNLSAAVLIPPKRKKHGLIFWIGGGAFASIMAVLLVILLRGGDSSAEVGPGDSPTSSFVEGFYNDESNIGVIPGLPLPVKQPGSEIVPGVKKPSIIKKPGGIKGTVLADPTRPRVGENFDDPTLGSVNQRDAEEVLDAQKRYGSGLKWCFERALKTNPDLKGRSNRYDVQITITAAGAVRSVSVGGNDKELKECVRQKVASWGFKPASGDFTTQFPIVFN